MTPTPALELVGLHKCFDGFVALADAHFAVAWGEVHALLGENGAGKSTLMNIAAGLYAPEAGELRVDGNPERLHGPADAARLKIGMVHQHFKLVRPFTVAENVLLGQPRPPGSSHRQRLAQVRQRIVDQARALGFAVDPDRVVASLSIAEQQRVEILKVLLAGARILILDEPTAVLTDQEAERLLLTVRELARQGSAVVLVTHKMGDVKAHADRVTVMRSGRTVATVDPRATPVAELVRLTVGDTAPTTHTQRPAKGAVRLSVQGLRLASAGGGRAVLDDVALQVRAGEIYGIAGVGGNGQAELAGAIMGLASAALQGEIHIDGQPAAAPGNPAVAAVPADRYALALAGPLSVAENFAIGQVRSGRYGPLWWLKRGAVAADAAAAVKAFGVQGVRSLRQKAALLSGGNAQKLVIAREFSKSPSLILAHSPSRGLDVRATAEVHARLQAACDGGCAVLLISEDLDEVMTLADRIGVMCRGHIVAEFDRPADRQAVGQAMVDHG